MPVNILGIHYFAPPTAVVAARRLSGIYRHFIAKGAKVDIITSNGHVDRPMEPAYNIQANYHFVQSGGLREQLAGKSNQTIDIQLKKKAIYRMLNRYRQSFPFLYLTDEGGLKYYKNAIKAGRQLIAEGNISHLLTSYRPWVDLRVGAALKAVSPNLYWIADFRDLPVDKLRSDVWLTKYQSRIAKEIIASANEIWVVSEGQAAQIADWHPNIKVVYNGLDQLPKVSTPPISDRFIINYSGSLYPQFQSITPLKNILRSDTSLATSLVKKGSFQYAGKDGAVWKSWLEETPKNKAAVTIINQGIVDQKVAKASQEHAATNLLLTWSATDYYGVLTAKLYDYLASGRPITALVNGPDDPELRRIIEGSGAGRVFCHGQSAALANWLTQLYQEWEINNGQLAWHTPSEKVRYLLIEEQLKGLPSPL